MEAFLRSARITQLRPLGTGTTKPYRATLTDGRRTHDAHVSTVDVSLKKYTTKLGTEYNFRDSYKFNIAAYRLDRMLDMRMIPPCVERIINEKPAAVSWWIDDVLGTELDRITKHWNPPDVKWWNEQNYCVRVFDQLIYNTDRNRGNLMFTKDWRVWMVDHTRAFRNQHALMDESRLVQCDRKLLARLKTLDEPGLVRNLSPYIDLDQIQAVLARRDLIVRHFEREVSMKGEDAVLFDLANDTAPVSPQLSRLRVHPSPALP
jgi:hypothetical protein